MCETKCGIENVVFVEDLIGGRFYFWDLLGPFGKIVTFCNKNHLVAMRRLEGHELGPDWKLRTPRTGRGELYTPKTNHIAWDDHHSSSADLPVSGRRTQDLFSCREA